MNVVIGAGPYGLSVAAHLRARGHAVRIFGDPMGTWRNNMPADMLLKSTPKASSLSSPRPGSTLRDYCLAHGIPPLEGDDIVSREVFVQYSMWFAARHTPDLEDTLVTHVERSGDSYDVTLATGERVRADNVIVAAGLAHFPYLPPTLQALASGNPSVDGPCSHSSQYGDITPLTDRKVAIVGAGQSALELATLAAEGGGKPVVIARTPQLRWGAPPPPARARHRLDPRRKPPSPLGPGYSLRALSTGAGFVRYLPSATRFALMRNVLGPSGAWWLRERYEDGHVETITGRWIRDAMLDGDGVALHLVGADGSEEKVHVDHVVAATGYRVDLQQLAFLDDTLRGNLRHVSGAPILQGSFESSAPRLYFVGQAAAPTFGPLMRFVAGTAFAAARVAEAVSRAAGQPQKTGTA